MFGGMTSQIHSRDKSFSIERSPQLKVTYKDGSTKSMALESYGGVRGCRIAAAEVDTGRKQRRPNKSCKRDESFQGPEW